jgi:hypothetical protein
MGEKHRHCPIYSKKEYGRIKLPSQPNKLYIYIYIYICIDNYTPTNNGPSFLGQVLGWWPTMHYTSILLQQFIHSRNPFSCSGGSNEWCCCCSKAIVEQFIKKFCKCVRVWKTTIYQVVGLKVSAFSSGKNSIRIQFLYGFWMLGVYVWPHSKGYDT